MTKIPKSDLWEKMENDFSKMTLALAGSSNMQDLVPIVNSLSNIEGVIFNS